MTVSKNNSDVVSPAERNYRIFSMLNVIVSLLAAAFPLIPTAVYETAGERTAFFSMIKAVNHDIGSINFRDGAFRLLMFYIIGAIFIVVGCVSVYYKARSAPAFSLGGSIMLFVFSVMWFSVNHDADPNAANVAISRISEVYDGTVAPVLMVVFASGAIAASVMALICPSMNTQKKSVKNSR